ncbi:uncharacterized protein LOC128239021 [Mya arenaria]|uniref:uncharacterized protein LOC128239021 n=1 Tax=Mya arenaria TaxID=6604 RepID=UPI0022E08122|nr:uncharacterized protein LOC128239021 [Mya arenaria]XP_052811401.1 uncharacterized protein LOC128239021 [Mya arenaria]XP_052811402.1 uncharacterized protein LOC128239021 [Mya arenaria]
MFVNPREMFILIIIVVLVSIVKGDNAHLSNYSNSVVSCHERGGLITLKMLKFNGLFNITGELDTNNDVLKDGESVWVQGHAQTGPYIALHTCMKFTNQNKHLFAGIRTFHSNILYECSVFCDHILHSTGYVGIYKYSCFCIYFSFRFPHIPECLDSDFMDTHNRIIVFRMIGNMHLNVHSKSANFNCLAASFPESGNPSYYNTKCASPLYGICTQRVDSDLSKKCQRTLGEFCFNEGKSTFLEHYRKCWLHNGTLIPFFSGITVSLNDSVMLGSFRAVKAVEDDCKSNDSCACLSITQFNGTIYIETENCSNENAFFCMDDLQEVSNIDESQTKYGVIRHTVPVCVDTKGIPAFAFIIIFIGIIICITFPGLSKWFIRGNSQKKTNKKHS